MKQVEYFKERKIYSDIDSEFIKKILPHRDPMLMIDHVHEVRPGLDENGEFQLLGTTIRASKRVNASEPSLKGHFPGRPIFPGVLILEAMAQSTAFAFVQEIEKLIDTDLNGEPLELYLIAVEDCKFKKMVTPGDTLEFTSKLYRVRGNFVFFECVAEVDGKTVSKAKIRSFVGL